MFWIHGAALLVLVTLVPPAATLGFSQPEVGVVHAGRGAVPCGAVLGLDLSDRHPESRKVHPAVMEAGDLGGVSPQDPEGLAGGQGVSRGFLRQKGRNGDGNEKSKLDCVSVPHRRRFLGLLIKYS
jgi:hypothetical protein